MLIIIHHSYQFLLLLELSDRSREWKFGNCICVDFEAREKTPDREM